MNIPPLFFLSFGSAYAAMLVALVRFPRLDKGGKALALLCIVNALQVSITFLMSMMRMKNLEVGNYYRPVEILLITAVFWFMLSGKVVRQRLAVLASAFVLVWIVDKIAFADPSQLNSNMAMLSRIIAVIMSILALYAGLREPDGPYTQRPLFWMGTSVLVYSSGTILLIGFSNHLAALGIEKFMSFWQINWILLLTGNLLYIKGLMCKPQLQT